MNSGAMFGNLDFYADETYYQEHPFAYLQTEDSIQEYRIVTVLKADRNLFPFQQKLADAEAVQEYLKAAKQREVFETGDDYLKCIYDKVLTLVTCSYEWSGARNIVLAVPVSGAVWSQKCS
jgi:sortase B